MSTNTQTKTIENAKTDKITHQASSEHLADGTQEVPEERNDTTRLRIASFGGPGGYRSGRSLRDAIKRWICWT